MKILSTCDPVAQSHAVNKLSHRDTDIYITIKCNKVNTFRSKIDMSSKSNSNSNNKQDSNNILSPFIEGIALTQSVAISLIDAYCEFLRNSPQTIEYWYNLFWNPQTTTEKQGRDKVKVE
jgi:hypothetical protein